MKIQSIIVIIILVFALLAVPTTSADKSKANLVRNLATLDAFHPDLSDDLYKEWLYFNFIDEANDLKFIVSFNIGGNLTGETGNSTMLMAYQIEDDYTQMGSAVGSYPIESVNYSADSPDLTLDENNYVRLMPNGYKVHAEGFGLNAFGEPIQMIYDATYIPKADPTLLFSGIIGDSGDMNWISAAPACKVEGSLTINGVGYNLEYDLNGVRGYHDHNWGIWDWDDNMGWDWGQAIEMNDEEPDTDVGRYTIVLGKLTNGSHTADTGNQLLLWKNMRQIAAFDNVTFEYVMMEPCPPYPACPGYIYATAESGDDLVTSVFHTSSAIPIKINQTSDFIIWELTGTYTVTGEINGKSIDFSTDGFAEYAY